MSGISAQYVDGLEIMIAELREQVAALTKERDSLTRTLEHMEHTRDVEQARHREMSAAMREQLAALAEQNEKMKDALKTVVDDAEECTDHDDWTAMLLSLDAYHIASTCIEEINELPDLATPVLNRIRAEGMRMAAEICEHISDEYREREGRRYPELKTDAESGASDCESSIRSRADELEKQSG